MLLLRTHVVALVITSLLTFAALGVAQQRDRQSILEDLRSPQLERRLAALDALPRFRGDVTEMIPELISILDNAAPPAPDLAIRALTGMKVNGAPVVTPLCKKLGDKNHTTRLLAVEALVAIGEKSVAPARGLLTSSSARMRASAAEVLRRLDQLESQELTRLAKDVDERVRIIAVNALAHRGKPAVPQLVALLSDPEPTVAVEATRALRTNQSDPLIAVPGLIKALPRFDVGCSAAETLGSYGVQAQEAVPWMIKAYPLGKADSQPWGWGDAAEEALKHIGPPHEQDIPLLCECLKHQNLEARILAVEWLGMLGPKGASSAPALVDAAHQATKEIVALSKLAATKSEDDRGDDNSGRVFVFAEYCADAVWRVTTDARRFLELTTSIAIEADGVLTFSHPTPWEALPNQACPLIEKMLQHSNSNVQSTALAGVVRMGVRGVALKDAVLALTDNQNAELSKSAHSALTAMGPAIGTDAGPKLLSGLNAGKISLRDFAVAVESVQVRSPELLSKLEAGLQSNDEWEVTACASALCSLSNDPAGTVATVIKAADDGKLTHRNAISALRNAKTVDAVLVKFFTKQLQHDDLWTRHDAANALGNLGDSAVPAAKSLERLLEDKYVENRLKAAKAIFLITNNAIPLQQQLAAAFASKQEDHRSDRMNGLETIAELKQAGASYLHYVVAELRATEPYFADVSIDALAAIGTKDAMAALEEATKSSDWLVSSKATEALRSRQKQSPK